MSDGTKTWVRWMSQSDTVVLVCQQGHSGRDRNWPRPRQQFCHRGGQALSSGWAIFFFFLPCSRLTGFMQILVVRQDMVQGQISQPVCSEQFLLLN